ncbi:MAG: hypothetical protein ACK553_15415 [Planctomycetota bacterium]|jgi:hypothetical protein
MSSLDPQSLPPEQPSPVQVKPKASNRSLYFLAGAMAFAGVAAYAVPKLLVQAYLAEEESKRKQGPIVGTRTDVKPPPGVSTDPYAGMSTRQGGNRGDE